MNIRNILIQTFNIFLAFVLMLTQGWFANGIESGQLFKWWGGGVECCSARFVWVQVGLLVISVVCTVWLYLRRRTFLPVKVRISPDRVVPRRVLALTISRSSYQWSPGQLSGNGITPLVLPGDLAGALVEMAKLGGEKKLFEWEQMLRAVQAHYHHPDMSVPNKHLLRLYLIGSKDVDGKKGTANDFEQCRDMICHYFPGLPKESVEKCEANFDSLDELIAVYRGIIAREAEHKKEIMLDVTSGTKVVSIAAAMVTLEHPQIEFQYVETNGDKNVRSFNVTATGEAQE